MSIGGEAAGPREIVKTALGMVRGRTPAVGKTILTYHRVGGGTRDELDLSTRRFEQQLDRLEDHRVQHLDDALDDIDVGDESPGVVITFDDGFDEVFTTAYPFLLRRRMPFTIYLSTAYMGGEQMQWPGGANDGSGRGLTWQQLQIMQDSGLMTVGNHTHEHVHAAWLDVEQLDRCTEAIEANLRVTPEHFAYPWGEPDRRAEELLDGRFRTSAVVSVGRVLTGYNPLRLNRLPVRRTDPAGFFAAKLAGELRPEMAYGRVVAAVRGRHETVITLPEMVDH